MLQLIKILDKTDHTGWKQFIVLQIRSIHKILKEFVSRQNILLTRFPRLVFMTNP